MEKKERISSRELNAEIVRRESAGAVRAVEFKEGDLRGCDACCFSSECYAKFDRICMAHNRADKKSVYFIRVRRGKGVEGADSSQAGVKWGSGYEAD